jgi:hypothetical protein
MCLKDNFGDYRDRLALLPQMSLAEAATIELVLSERMLALPALQKRTALRRVPQPV